MTLLFYSGVTTVFSVRALQFTKPTSFVVVRFWCAKAADSNSLVCVCPQLGGAECLKGPLIYLNFGYALQAISLYL